MKNKAEKKLKSFLEHLEKHGFDSKVKRFLTLEWNNNKEYFEKLKEHLKEKEFSFGNVKYKSFDNQMKTYTFQTKVNEKKCSFFVRFETEYGTPFKYGNPKIIPIKLFGI